MTFPLPWPTPIDIHSARLLAVHLCEYACNGSRGRPEKGDPVYNAVTEGRDFGAGYSSCGDLPHWMFETMGVRMQFLNRESMQYRLGRNISSLCSVSAIPSKGQRFESGDVLVIWNKPNSGDAHALVVLDDRGEELQAAQYGAPGGQITWTKRMADRLGTRQQLIRRWISLERILTVAQQGGHLVDAEDPSLGPAGEVLWRPPTCPIQS